MDYESICRQAITIVQEAGEYIRTQRAGFQSEMVESKGIHNFVSYVDKEAERLLVAGFTHILPESTFITEEETTTGKLSDWTWIIDPLDGTTNFIHNLPPYAVSVALMHQKELVLGIILEITGNECFYSWKGGEVYLNDKKVCCSPADKVHDSLIATGFPYYDYERMKQFLYSLEYFMRNSHGVRRLGSAATDLAYVACGRFEGFFEYGLSPWDVAAGAFLVKQAGGNVCDYRLGEDYVFGKEIIASNPGIYKEFSGLLNEMYKAGR